MAKMDEARFESCIGDTPEQIQMCMNCPYEECIDCIRYGHDSYGEVRNTIETIKEIKKHIKKLANSERKILRYYPYAKTDIDLSKMAGITQSMACNCRKRLGLPVIRLTNQEMRKKLVAMWLEDEVRT